MVVQLIKEETYLQYPAFKKLYFELNLDSEIMIKCTTDSFSDLISACFENSSLSAMFNRFL